MRMRASAIRFGVALLAAAWAAGCAAAWAGDTERGNRRIAEGDYSGAAAEYRAVLADEPGNRDARYGLARALAFSGDYGGSEREYRAVLAEHPGDVEARLGLADVLAWQKRYGEAQEVLRPAAEARPDDVEVLLRQGKVSLWAGDLPASRSRFERVLALSPGNPEAVRGIAAVEAAGSSAYGRELETGLSLLRITNANPGTQGWVALQDKTLRPYAFLGRVDYLHRYGRDEGRGTLGATRAWEGGRSLRLEGALSPGSEIFARAAVEGEAASPIVKRVAGYAGARYATYATADTWSVSAALEAYVLPGNSPLLVRYVLTHTRFDQGGDSNDGTWLVKLNHFLDDDNRVWAYYSRGAEGYATGTIDQVANFSSYSLGAGGRWYPGPRWGIEGNVDWQNRQDGVEFTTFTAALHYRF